MNSHKRALSFETNTPKNLLYKYLGKIDKESDISKHTNSKEKIKTINIKFNPNSSRKKVSFPPLKSIFPEEDLNPRKTLEHLVISL